MSWKKGTNTDPIHITAQEDANPVEEQTQKDVGEQTRGTTSVHTNRSSSVNHQRTLTTPLQLSGNFFLAFCRAFNAAATSLMTIGSRATQDPAKA